MHHKHKHKFCHCFDHHYRYGLVSDVKPGYARVSFAEDAIPSDWLPIVVRRTQSDKENWQLEINEQVVCIMDGDCDEGFIIGAIPSKVDTADNGEAAGKFRKLFSDGTLIEYDKGAHTLTVDVKGDIVGKGTGSITIEAPTITLQGDVTVTGNLSAASIATSGTGNITTNGDLHVAGKSFLVHVHPGVQTGSGVTGTPQ